MIIELSYATTEKGICWNVSLDARHLHLLNLRPDPKFITPLLTKDRCGPRCAYLDGKLGKLVAPFVRYRQ
jgi:hypothetical protein